MTHVYTYSLVRSVALVAKKLWAILNFFLKPDFFPHCTLPYELKNKKNFNKNPLNYKSLKVTKFYGDSFKNESARTKNYREVAPNSTPPQPV